MEELRKYQSVYEQEIGNSFTDAVNRGFKYYYGFICKKNSEHVSKIRRVSNRDCFQCGRKASNERATKNRAVNITQHMFNAAKQRCRKSGIPFSITRKDIDDVWPVDNKCPILRIDLMVSKGGKTINSPSLDRIKPSVGYVKGNIAILSLKANRIKNDETDPAAFRAVADWVELNIKGPR